MRLQISNELPRNAIRLTTSFQNVVSQSSFTQLPKLMIFDISRLWAAPLFAFCLLRSGLSEHSRNAPLSVVCFIHFLVCVLLSIFVKLVDQQHFSSHCVAKLSNNSFHKSCVRKELTATLCVRVWSWCDIATQLQFVILVHSAMECTSLSMVNW